MTSITRSALLVGLLAAAGLTACQKEAPKTTPAAAAVANPAAGGDAKAATGTDAKAATAPAEAKNTAATKTAPTAQPKAAAPAAVTGELKPGQNSPTFLDGIAGKGPLYTTIETTMGVFNCQLHEKKSPQSVLNFVGLARGLKPFMDPDTKKFTKRPFYDGIIFHRVIPQFMIQVGDPKGVGTYNPGYKFDNEKHADLKFDKGGIMAMANAGPNTNGAQFFITEQATPHLNGGYSIFGQCDNAQLVAKMARVATGPRNKPLEPISIKKVTFRRGK